MLNRLPEVFHNGFQESVRGFTVVLLYSQRLPGVCRSSFKDVCIIASRSLSNRFQRVFDQGFQVSVKEILKSFFITKPSRSLLGKFKGVFHKGFQEFFSGLQGVGEQCFGSLLRSILRAFLASFQMFFCKATSLLENFQTFILKAFRCLFRMLPRGSCTGRPKVVQGSKLHTMYLPCPLSLRRKLLIGDYIYAACHNFSGWMIYLLEMRKV